MLHAIIDFWLNAKRSGLGQDAVIEIMIALLGVMVSVLTLFVAVLSVFGYVVITRGARKSAAKIAKRTATEIIRTEIKRVQGISMAVDQPNPPDSTAKIPGTPGRKTSDASLRKKRTDDPK